MTIEKIGIIVAAVCSLITVLLSFINIFITDRATKKQLRVNYITDKRVQWISDVRAATAEYLSVIDALITKLYEPKRKEFVAKEVDSRYDTMRSILEKLNSKEYLLKLLLNFQGDIDSLIIQNMDRINLEIEHGGDDYDAIAELITMHTQIYLKLEWNRVNNEVKCKDYPKSQMIQEAIKLYKEYECYNESQKKEVGRAVKKLNESLDKNSNQ